MEKFVEEFVDPATVEAARETAFASILDGLCSYYFAVYIVW
jgi:hypothetical protein